MTIFSNKSCYNICMINTSKISEQNKTFFFFLIFTAVTSVFAYNIIMTGYDNFFALSEMEVELLGK